MEFRKMLMITLQAEENEKDTDLQNSLLDSVGEAEGGMFQEKDWCTPNQLKMKHISPSLKPQTSHILHHIQQVAWPPLQQSRDSLRHPSQVYRNINFNKATG